MKGETRRWQTRLEHEVESLRSELTHLRAQHRHLAELTASYMRQAPLDRPERVRNATTLADMTIAVVGGEPVPSGELEECAAVGRRDIAGLSCSGVLVSSRIVVTAAHCGPLGNHPIPTAAALRLNDTSDLSNAEVIDGQFVSNPNFTVEGASDIAVMVLEENSTVAPVELASTAEMAAATQVTMAGFGDDDLMGTVGLGIKRSVTVPIQFLAGGPLDTIPVSTQPGDFDPALEFLAGTARAGACFGDSGGPAYINVAGQRKLAGIVSRPPQKQHPVCKGLTVCTRIDVFTNWIRAQTP